MLITLVVSTSAVLLAFLARYGNIRWGLKAAFAIIFLFLALRYEFGNDYDAYLQYFSGDTDSALVFEPGWVYLNQVFQPLGFFAMIAVLAFLNCLVYYRFIEKYVPANLYWLAVFLYVFSPELMLIHSSAMRQSVAIMLFVVSLDYLYSRQALRYFACITLATLFHFSAIILFPLYLVGHRKWNIGTRKGSILVSLYVSLFLFSQSIAPLLEQFIGSYFEKYLLYQNPGSVNTGLGFLYLSAMFVVLLSYERSQDRKTAIAFELAIIGSLLVPLTLLINMSARMGMYFAPATIVAYPVILGQLRSAIKKAVYLSLLLVFVFYRWMTFFNSDNFKDYFGTYQTIFSSR